MDGMKVEYKRVKYSCYVIEKVGNAFKNLYTINYVYLNDGISLEYNCNYNYIYCASYHKLHGIKYKRVSNLMAYLILSFKSPHAFLWL